MLGVRRSCVVGLFVVSCVPPPAPPPVLAAGDTTPLVVTNHTSRSICHIWQYMELSFGSGSWIWQPLLDARSTADCVAPGAAVTLRALWSSQDHARSIVAAENLAARPPTTRDLVTFTALFGHPMTFEDPASLKDEVIKFPNNKNTDPLTIEGRERQLLVVETRARAEEERQHPQAEVEAAANKKRARALRGRCLAGTEEPNDAPTALDIAGKWTCALTGDFAGEVSGHATLSIVAGTTTGAFAITEEIWSDNENLGHVTKQVSGTARGKTVWVTGEGGRTAEFPIVAELSLVAGGLRATQTEWKDPCTRLKFVCTR